MSPYILLRTIATQYPVGPQVDVILPTWRVCSKQCEYKTIKLKQPGLVLVKHCSIILVLQGVQHYDYGSGF